MKDYLKSWIPRLAMFSQDLNKITRLNNQPWVILDGDGVRLKIIFQSKGILDFSKKGKLTVSRNGIVTDGSWELFSQANSLMLDFGCEKKLYNSIFLDEALLILALDGDKSHTIILINENVIPDLDVLGYINNNYRVKWEKQREKIESPPIEEIEKFRKIERLKDGRELQILDGSSQTEVGSEVLIDHNVPINGYYRLKYGGYIYEVQDGILASIHLISAYNLNSGKYLFISSDLFGNFDLDAPAWLDDQIAPNGTYSTGLFSSVIIDEGKVKQINRLFRTKTK